jgi:magnesium chelatase subunit I
MEYLKITSLAILKNSGWKSKSIKDELRDNLIRYKKEKKDIFTDIHGY